jgi:hypothetical protein
MLSPRSDFFAAVVTFSPKILPHLPIKKKLMQADFWKIACWGEK